MDRSSDEIAAYLYRLQKYGVAAGFPRECLDGATMRLIVQLAPNDAVSVIPTANWTVCLYEELARSSPEAFGKLEKLNDSMMPLSLIYARVISANKMVIAHIPEQYQDSRSWDEVLLVRPTLYEKMPDKYKKREHVDLLKQRGLLGRLYCFIPPYQCTVEEINIAVAENPSNIQYTNIDIVQNDTLLHAVEIDPCSFCLIPERRRSMILCYAALQAAKNMGDLAYAEVEKCIPERMREIQRMIC